MRNVKHLATLITNIFDWKHPKNYIYIFIFKEEANFSKKYFNWNFFIKFFFFRKYLLKLFGLMPSKIIE